MVGWLTGSVWWAGSTRVAARQGCRPRSGPGVVRARPTPRPIGYTLVWPFSRRPFSLADGSLKGEIRPAVRAPVRTPAGTPATAPTRPQSAGRLARISFPPGSAETDQAVHRHMHGEGGHKIHAEIERCVCETGGGLLRHIDGTNAGTEPSVQPHRSASLLLAQSACECLFACSRCSRGWRRARDSWSPPRHSPQRQQPGAMPKRLSHRGADCSIESSSLA